MSDHVDGTAADELECSLDALYDVLSHAHRRYALSRLSELTEPISAVDLAREIAAWESEPSADAVPREVRRIRAALVHSHLPKMADANLVDYDEDRGTVAVAESTPGDDWIARLAAVSA